MKLSNLLQTSSFTQFKEHLFLNEHTGQLDICRLDIVGVLMHIAAFSTNISIAA